MKKFRVWWAPWALLGILSCQTTGPGPESSLADPQYVTPHAAQAAPLNWIPEVPSLELPEKISPSARSRILSKLMKALQIIRPKLATRAELVNFLSKNIGANGESLLVSPARRMAPPSPVKLSYTPPVIKPQIGGLPQGRTPSSAINTTTGTPGKTTNSGISAGRPPLLPTQPDVDLLKPTTTLPLAAMETKEILVKVGEDVFFQFPKLNWLLTTPKEVTQKAGFQNQSFGASTTSFLFKPQAVGAYTLDFLRQDLAQGQEERKQFVLKVLPPGSNVDTSARAPEAQDLGEIFQRGRDLERAGKVQDALDLYLAHYDPASHQLNSRIANLLEQNRDDSGAKRYWERNLGEGNPAQGEALQRLTSLSLRSQDDQSLLRYLELIAKGAPKVTEEEFLRSLDLILSKNHLERVGEMGAFYPAWYPQPKHEDWYLMLWAQFLEKPGRYRDLRKSMETYQNLQNRFPLSPFWDEASKRKEYLKRNFFEIR